MNLLNCFLEASLNLIEVNEKWSLRTSTDFLLPSLIKPVRKRWCSSSPLSISPKTSIRPSRTLYLLLRIPPSVSHSVGVALHLVFPGTQHRKPEPAARQAKKESPEEACIAPAGNDHRLIEQHFPYQKQLRRFTFEELRIATEDFKVVLGKGGFGTVYKGRLSSGCLVAVKILSQWAAHGLEEFHAEVDVGKMVMHRNVVPLIGFCEVKESNECAIVYALMQKGTLFSHLHNRPESQPALTWSIRKRISLGVARGLSYLHDDCFLRIIHRDVKTTNIMLDEKLEPRLGDFGLARFMDHKQEGFDMDGITDRDVESNNILLDQEINAEVGDYGLRDPVESDDGDHVSTAVVGTPGYLDPEYFRTFQLTEKSDVYGFGVCCLELITGRKPVGQGKHIVEVVKTAMDRSEELYGLQEILDPALISSRPQQLRGLEKFVDLSMRCVEESGSDRPTMREVVREIENLMA